MSQLLLSPIVVCTFCIRTALCRGWITCTTHRTESLSGGQVMSKQTMPSRCHGNSNPQKSDLIHPENSEPENSDCENSDPKIQTLKTQTPKNQILKTQTPQNNIKRFKPASILITVLWSRNVHRQQPERSKIFIFSGSSLSRQSNSEKHTRFYHRNRKAESL